MIVSRAPHGTLVSAHPTNASIGATIGPADTVLEDNVRGYT